MQLSTAFNDAVGFTECSASPFAVAALEGMVRLTEQALNCDVSPVLRRDPANQVCGSDRNGRPNNCEKSERQLLATRYASKHQRADANARGCENHNDRSHRQVKPTSRGVDRRSLNRFIQ
jgi:hypothetical protein